MGMATALNAVQAMTYTCLPHSRRKQHVSHSAAAAAEMSKSRKKKNKSEAEAQKWLQQQLDKVVSESKKVAAARAEQK